MEFQYDVFLSYSRADRDWARRLHGSLSHAAVPYKTFFDYESLRAGDDWEAAIQSALESSRHFLVLWSEQARQSDWVTRELWTFFANAKPKTDTSRRLICVNLRGMNQATKAFQQIVRPDLQAAHAAGGTLPDPAWNEIFADVEDGLNPKKRPLPVPLVILTLSRPELDALPADRWSALKTEFGLSETFLRSRYGAARDDWRPFAGGDSILSLLEGVRGQVSASLRDFRVYWSRPEDTFWSDIMAARKFVTAEFDTGELSVLVVDPVALYHPDVYQRLMLFQQCFDSSRRVILALPPFGVPHRIIRLRSALVSRAMPYFDDYFQPAVPPRRPLAAYCGWNVSDSEDIQRLILAAAGQLSSGGGAQPASAFIRHGADR